MFWRIGVCVVRTSGSICFSKRATTFTSPKPHKRSEFLADVARELRRRNFPRPVQFVVTLREDHPTTQALIKRSEKLGLGDRIVNLGPQPVTAGPDLYRGCHISFVPTVLEVFTATYPESMAMGLPIPVALHSFSHNSAVGHSTPQAPPRMLLALMVRIAPVTFRKRNFLINAAGSVSAGHPFEQGASWHSKQRSASARACPKSNPVFIFMK